MQKSGLDHSHLYDLPSEVSDRILEYATADLSRHSAQKTITLGPCSRAVWRVAPYHEVSSLLLVSHQVNKDITELLSRKRVDLGITIYFHCLDPDDSDFENFSDGAGLPARFVKFASSLTINFFVLNGCTRTKRSATVRDFFVKEQVCMASALSVGRKYSMTCASQWQMLTQARSTKSPEKSDREDRNSRTQPRPGLCAGAGQRQVLPAGL